jgi:hypothetical protein
MAELDWLYSGVHKMLNFWDALLMTEVDLELSILRSSSGIGLATWKSLPSHNRLNGDDLLTSIADTPWA